MYIYTCFSCIPLQHNVIFRLTATCKQDKTKTARDELAGCLGFILVAISMYLMHAKRAWKINKTITSFFMILMGL